MFIEYTNTIHPRKKRFFPTILIVLGLLLLIPTTLILIGHQNKKDPTGNYLSPLPEGQLTQTNSTSEETMTLTDLINLSQNLIVASPQQQNISTASAKNSSNTNIVTITLPAGQTQLEITDPQITTNSYIYIIPQTKTNQVIYVSSRKEGSFTISTNKPFNYKIDLDYWVINH